MLWTNVDKHMEMLIKCGNHVEETLNKCRKQGEKCGKDVARQPKYTKTNPPYKGGGLRPPPQRGRPSAAPLEKP